MNILDEVAHAMYASVSVSDQWDKEQEHYKERFRGDARRFLEVLKSRKLAVVSEKDVPAKPQIKKPSILKKGGIATTKKGK